METQALDSSPAEILISRIEDSRLPEHLCDREADRQIQECLSSQEFVNKVISYSYEHTSWKFRLLVNPEKKQLVFGDIPGSGFMHFDVALVAKEGLPESLQHHLLEMVQVGLESHLCLSGHCRSDFDMFAQLIPDQEAIHAIQPVFIPLPPLLEGTKNRSPVFRRAEFVSSFDLANDQKISQMLKSDRFVKTIIPYAYQGEVYELYLVYNPEQEPLKIETRYSPIQNTCIFASKMALPQPLSDHLKGLFKTIQVDFNTGDYRSYNFPELDSLSLLPLYDVSADAKMKEALQSQKFVKMTLHYTSVGKTYELLLIYNPEKKPLEHDIGKSFILCSRVALPHRLRSHLEILCQTKDVQDQLFELREVRLYSFEFLNSLKPLSPPTVVADPKPPLSVWDRWFTSQSDQNH